MLVLNLIQKSGLRDESKKIATSRKKLFTTTANNQAPFTVISKISIPNVVPGSSSEDRNLQRDKSKILKRQVTKSFWEEDIEK